MPTPITMPQLAETTTEGTIGRWMKAPGEQVKRYEPLVEIMTDKVNVEMTSPVSGVLVEILAPEGETIPVGGMIAQIAEESGAAPGQPSPESLSSSGAKDEGGADQAPPPHAQTATNGRSASAPATASAGTPGSAGILPAGAAGVSPAVTQDRPRQRLTPVVARLVEQHQIDVTQLTGTGIDGRVTKQDVLSYLDGVAQAPPQRPTALEGQGIVGVAVSDSSAPGSAGILPAAAAGVSPAPTPSTEDQTIPITPLRRAIAENTVRSKTTAPHAWTMTEIDVTNLVRLRESHKADFQQREGVDLTYLPFFVKVVAETLTDHPTLNATWTDDKIILKRRINIGIAVNRQEGLIVPVIKDAGRLSLTGLAHALSDVITRARTNALKLEDVTGGTFTLNNTGALGVTLSYPIIVPGQAAILTTEAIIKRPVVIDDAIAIRSMMNMAIAFDHRITDGGIVGSFLKTIKSRLEALGANGVLQ